MTEVLWRPHDGPQTEFLRRIEDEALFGGSKGPGKTDALIYGGLRQVDHPQYHAAIFRRTYPELQEIMDRMHQRFPRLGATWNEAKKRWVFPSGARYSCFYMKEEKDKYLHQGKEYHYLGFDQVEQMTEGQVSFLQGCSRTSYPGLTVTMRASANPGGVGHLWVKNKFIDLGDSQPYTDPDSGLTRVFISANIYDNPAVLEHDPAYLRRLMALPEAERRAYLYGDWDVFSGQYFPEWRRATHIVELTRAPEPWQERIGGMDWGYDPSPGVVLIGAVDESERVVIYDELTFRRSSPYEVAGLIHERWPTVNAIIEADPSMRTPSIDTGVCIMDTINETLAELGSNIMVRSANRDRLNGWARVHQYFHVRQAPDGMTPWCRFAELDLETGIGCPELIKTIPAQVHNERMTGDMEKGSTDHHADALRYMLMARPPLSIEPVDERTTHGQKLHARTKEIMGKILERHNKGMDVADGEALDLFDETEQVADIWV